MPPRSQSNLSLAQHHVGMWLQPLTRLVNRDAAHIIGVLMRCTHGLRHDIDAIIAIPLRAFWSVSFLWQH